ATFHALERILNQDTPFDAKVEARDHGGPGGGFRRGAPPRCERPVIEVLASDVAGTLPLAYMVAKRLQIAELVLVGLLLLRLFGEIEEGVAKLAKRGADAVALRFLASGLHLVKHFFRFLVVQRELFLMPVDCGVIEVIEPTFPDLRGTAHSRPPWSIVQEYRANRVRKPLLHCRKQGVIKKSIPPGEEGCGEREFEE